MRPEKSLMVKEIEERLQGGDTVFLTSYNGLKASYFNDIRWEGKDLSADFMVIKNRLLNRAVKELYDIDLAGEYDGQTAITVCSGDAVSVLKFIMKIGKKSDGVEVKLGIMNKELLKEDRIKVLATLPGRDVLIAQTVGAIGAPLTGFVFLLKNMLSSLVTVMKNIEDKKQKEA